MQNKETIFKSCSKTGNNIKKYKIQQKLEQKINNGTETQINVHCDDMSIYGLLEHVKKENKENKHIWHTMLNRTTIR